MSLLDNLISYWKLDESSGNALDAHGSNEMTQTGTVSSQTGKVGNARGVYSSSSYFSIANTSSLEVGDIDFTVACWVYLTSKPSPTMVTRSSASAVVYWLLHDWSVDYFQFRVYETSGSSTSVWSSNAGSVSVNTWYHVIAWHDSVNNQLGISVNAGSPNTQTFSNGAANINVNTYIGYSPWTQQGFANGYIDEVGFWKRVLTSQERSALYNSGSGLAYPFSTPGAVLHRPRPRRVRNLLRM